MNLLLWTHAAKSEQCSPTRSLRAIAARWWPGGFLESTGYDDRLKVEAFSDVTVLAGKTRVWRSSYTSQGQLAAHGIVFKRRNWA